VQWVCAAHPYVNLDHPFADDIDRFVADLAGRVPFRVPSSLRYLCASWDCGTRPNAGVSAIVDLLSFGLARLYVTGFTFYTGPQTYHEDYRGSGVGPEHRQDGQRAFVAHILRTDGRLTVDAALGRILNG
jgi:hypothetical protein